MIIVPNRGRKKKQEFFSGILFHVYVRPVFHQFSDEAA